MKGLTWPYLATVGPVGAVVGGGAVVGAVVGILLVGADVGAVVGAVIGAEVAGGAELSRARITWVSSGK